MPRKEPGEKWRYIAFRIEGGTQFARSDFLHALLIRSRATELGDSFRITVFSGDFGILKVPHTLKDEAVRVLNSLDDIRGASCKVVTLRTSGTIKTLKEKYKDLVREDQE
jgi:RNase P/RNase MRP subunit POP5